MKSKKPANMTEKELQEEITALTEILRSGEATLEVANRLTALRQTMLLIHAAKKT